MKKNNNNNNNNHDPPNPSTRVVFVTWRRELKNVRSIAERRRDVGMDEEVINHFPHVGTLGSDVPEPATVLTIFCVAATVLVSIAATGVSRKSIPLTDTSTKSCSFFFFFSFQTRKAGQSD
jgi:hypothetical protein